MDVGCNLRFLFHVSILCFLDFNKKRAWITAIICFVLNWCCCNYYESAGKADGANFLFLSINFVVGGIVYLYKEDIKEKVSNIPVPCVLITTAFRTVIWYLIPADEFSLFFTLKTVVLFSMWMVMAISHPLKFWIMV